MANEFSDRPRPVTSSSEAQKKGRQTPGPSHKELPRNLQLRSILRRLPS